MLLWILCWIFLLIPSLVEGEGPINPQKKQFQATMTRIKNLRTEKDVNGLWQLAAELKGEWFATKNSQYCPIILEICLALNSTPSTPLELRDSVRNLAVSMIDSPVETPPEIKAKFLLLLQGDPEYARGQLTGEEWIKERRTRAERWLKVWKRLCEQLASLPEPSGPFYLHPDPPPETKLPLGVAPSAIKDPVLRKRYEEAIEKNTRNADAYRKKRDFEELEKSFAGRAKRYIVEAYCKPPFRTEEMVMTLEKYGIDKESRVAMLEEVSRRVTLKIEQDAKLAKALEASKAKAPESVPFRENPLSTDQRLRVSITVNMMKPKVEEILALLRSKTGLPITVSSHIPKDRLAFWSVSFHNVPAYAVMEELNKAVVEKGHWVKEENGYRLVGELKPTLESLREAQVKKLEAQPGRSGFAVVWTIVSIIVLACLAVVAFFYRRKQHPKV